jgi:hypothetical protein
MTGADSGIYVFWFHPSLHAYEQGIDGEVEELNLAPGDVVGQFSFVQKSPFPFMSYITDYRVKINRGDIFPYLAGDQFSPFGYSMYYDSPDSLPVQPAASEGNGRFCGGEPCGDLWAENQINWLNLDGADMWFGLDWADSTPSAPQIKATILPNAKDYNLWGERVGEVYFWNRSMYYLIFRYRFLTPFTIDSQVEPGWRRPLEMVTRPDSFLIKCHGVISSQYIVGTDTLYFQIPPGKVDSVEVFTFHDNRLEDTSLILRFIDDMVAPLTAEVSFEKKTLMSYDFNLIISNCGPEAMELILGYDNNQLECLDAVPSVGGYETAVVPFRLTATESDSLELLITIQDKGQFHYPLLVSAVYPPRDPTDVEEEGDSPGIPDIRIRTYPNPCHGRMVISLPRSVQHSTIELFNVIGQKIKEWSSVGGRDVTWDGRIEGGARLPAGIYFVRVTDSRGAVQSKKIILLR